MVALAAAILLWRSSGAPAAPGPTSLVLVTIDTLRADRLDTRRMPALSRFADGGLRFDNARTPAPLTLPAHASLMTGLLPPDHGARENGAPLAPGARTIARELRDAGFRTGAFVSAFVLDRQFGLADGFETYDDRVPRSPDAALRLEAAREGGATIAAALAWLGTIDRSRERFFLWVHLFEPHTPYAPSADCGASAEANGDGGTGAYDRDVACADVLAGKLIDAIASGPGAGSIAWIVAGDHGEALGEHGESTHGMLLYDATLRVPLIVRGAGVAPGRSAAPVSLADIAPTALSWLGLPRPAAMRGSDLRMPLAADRDVYSETLYPRTAGWHGLSAVSGERWKAIRSSETELYDVTQDRAETANVAAAHPKTAAAMGAEAARLAASGAGRTSAPSAEAAERLRALGYASGGAPSPGDRGGAPNPAAHIRDWVQFEHALTAMSLGRAADALASLAALAAKHPAGRVFRSTYARALSDTGAHGRALQAYRQMLATWPDDAMLFHDFASAARSAGDATEAARAEQAALALDPDNAAALNGLGLTFADAGRPAEAASAFERAAAGDPGNASYWTNLGNARRALGDAARAEAAYRRALDVSPAHADGLNGLGALMVQSGRAPQAVGLFERALAADAAHIEARLNLAIAFQESGRLDEARRAYRDVIMRAPAGTREHAAATALLNSLK